MEKTDTQPGSARRPIWELTRRERTEEYLWGLLPWGLLLISSVLMLVESPDPIGGKLLTLAIAAGAAAWHGILFVKEPAWSDRIVPLAVHYAGQLLFLWFLLDRDGWYALCYFALIVNAFILPRMWAAAGVIAVVLTAYASNAAMFGGQDNSAAETAGNLVFNILFSLGLGLLIRSNMESADRRRRALKDLAEAHERLEASMTENAGLQRQLLTQAREAGVLDERARLAREIHDTIAQGLTGVITQLETVEKTVHDEGARQHLDSARALARDSLSEARRSVEALRPRPLESARLPDALADVVARWAESNDVKADVTTTGTVVPMHPEIEVTLLRVAQEALANVARHAQASRVGLTLSYMTDQLTLDVRDDGTGFDADALPAGTARPDGGGFGLTAMRQRLTRLAGTLEIESQPGQGTAISASVPAVPAGGTP